MQPKISNNSPPPSRDSSSLSLSPLIHDLIKRISIPTLHTTKAYEERINEQIENSKNHRYHITDWLKGQFNTAPSFYNTLSAFTIEKPQKEKHSKSPKNVPHKTSDSRMRTHSYTMTTQASMTTRSDQKSKSPRSCNGKLFTKKISNRSNSTEMITVKSNNLKTNFSNMQSYRYNDKLIKPKTLSSSVSKSQNYNKSTKKSHTFPSNISFTDNIVKNSIKLPNLQLITSINRNIPRIKLDFSNIILNEKDQLSTNSNMPFSSYASMNTARISKANLDIRNEGLNEKLSSSDRSHYNTHLKNPAIRNDSKTKLISKAKILASPSHLLKSKGNELQNNLKKFNEFKSKGKDKDKPNSSPQTNKLVPKKLFKVANHGQNYKSIIEENYSIAKSPKSLTTDHPSCLSSRKKSVKKNVVFDMKDSVILFESYQCINEERNMERVYL